MQIFRKNLHSRKQNLKDSDARTANLFDYQKKDSGDRIKTERRTR